MMTDAMWNDADPVSPLSSPDEGTGTAVLERPETREQSDMTDNGDADRFAHYVSKAARCGCPSMTRRSIRCARTASASTTRCATGDGRPPADM